MGLPEMILSFVVIAVGVSAIVYILFHGPKDAAPVGVGDEVSLGEEPSLEEMGEEVAENGEAEEVEEPAEDSGEEMPQ